MKKKIMKLITAFACMVGMTITAKAAMTTINETFFPDGKMSTPSAPYVRYVDKYDDGAEKIGSTELFFDIPEELLKLNDEYAILGEEAFCEKYNTPMRYDSHEALRTCIQIDTKFDDGPWLSESGNWDRFEYGEDLYDSNLNYRLAIERYMDETSKNFRFEQSWLVYNEPDNEANAFLQPYLKTVKDEYGDDMYQLDTENHTFSYRIRFIVYTNNWEDLNEGEDAYWCFSDWSPATSIGKNGNQGTLEKPTKVDAPILSDFSLIKNEENGVEAKYYVEFTKYTYDSIKYYEAIEEYYEPFYIESQIRVNGGEWIDTYTANAASLSGGYRATDSNDVEITMDSQVEIRVRIVCSAMDGKESEWSNIVGNKAAEEIVPTETVENSVEEKPEVQVTEVPEPTKDKCKVCGICPFQPLGICLFIWLVIIIVVVLVITIVIKKMKDKNNEEKKKK